MCDSAVFYFEATKKTEVKQHIFRILGNEFLDLLEDVVKDDLASLFFEFSQLGDSSRVNLNGREGEVDLILHFHAVLDQEFLHEADN